VAKQIRCLKAITTQILRLKKMLIERIYTSTGLFQENSC